MLKNIKKKFFLKQNFEKIGKKQTNKQKKKTWKIRKKLTNPQNTKSQKQINLWTFCKSDNEITCKFIETGCRKFSRIQCFLLIIEESKKTKTKLKKKISQFILKGRFLSI